MRWRSARSASWLHVTSSTTTLEAALRLAFSRSPGIITGRAGSSGGVDRMYSAKLSARATEADAGRIRELLAKYGDRDSLGYFALRSDKNVIWSPSGQSCIGYRVVSGVMLASGDPIGDPEAWPGRRSSSGAASRWTFRRSRRSERPSASTTMPFPSRAHACAARH